jgi:hypothetical protein
LYFYTLYQKLPDNPLVKRRGKYFPNFFSKKIFSNLFLQKMFFSKFVFVKKNICFSNFIFTAELSHFLETKNSKK